MADWEAVNGVAASSVEKVSLVAKSSIEKINGVSTAASDSDVFVNQRGVTFDGDSVNGFITADNKDPATSSSGSIYANLEADQAWSFTFWIKTDSGGASGSPEYLITKYATFGVAIGMEGPGNIYTILKDNLGNRTDLETSTSLADNAWHHVSVVYDGAGTFASGTATNVPVSPSSLKVYIDGGSSQNLFRGYSGSTATLSGSFQQTTSFVMGGYAAASSAANIYEGNLDEVAFWDVALSEAEAAAIYNSGVPTDLNSHSQASKLISWWRMGDGTGDTLSATTSGATNLATNLITDMSTAASYTRNNASARNRAAVSDCQITAVAPYAGTVTAFSSLSHWYQFPSFGEASFPPGGVNTIIDVGTSTATRDNIDATNIAGQSSGRTLGANTFNTYDFNGTNANATSIVGYNSTLFPADDFSFTAWVKWDTVANFEMIFMAGDVGAQNFSEGYYLYPILTAPLPQEANGYAPGTATPDNVLVFSSGGYNASSGGSLVYASIPSTGTWFHVACTIDVSGNAQAIYVNGTAGTGPGVTVQAPTSTNENRFLSIGAYQINGGSQHYRFDGEMSDVRFYNKALSSAEVSSIYAGDFSP